MSDSFLSKLDLALLGDVPDKILRAIAAAADEPLATEAELGELARLDAAYKKFDEIMQKHGPADAKAAFLKQEARPSGVQPQLKSRATIDGEFQQTRASCKRQMLGASAAAHPLAAGIIKRFEIHCSRLADRFEAEERLACEKFGITWAPSPVVKVLREAPGAARNRLPKIPGVSLMAPHKMIRFLPPA